MILNGGTVRSGAAVAAAQTALAAAGFPADATVDGELLVSVGTALAIARKVADLRAEVERLRRPPY